MKNTTCIAVVIVCVVGVLAGFGNADVARKFDPSTAVRQFLAEDDFVKSAEILKGWERQPVGEKVALLDELSTQLESTEHRQVSNVADMVVASRVGNGPGQMRLMGDGYTMQQDVFIVGGKAAWAIETIVDAEGGGPAIIEKMDERLRKVAVRGMQALIAAYKKGVADALKSLPAPGGK